MAVPFNHKSCFVGKMKCLQDYCSFQEDPSRWAIPQDPSKNVVVVVVVVVVGGGGGGVGVDVVVVVVLSI